MDNLNLISNFAEFKELKNIDKATMIGVLEDVFPPRASEAVRDGREFRRHHQPREGDLEIWRNRTVVEDAPSRIPIRRSPCRRSRPSTRPTRSATNMPTRSNSPRSAVAPCCRCAKPGIAHPRPGEGQPLREVFGEGRRDCHRRSLPGVEKGGADPRRRGERADPAKAEQIPNDFYRKGTPSRLSSSRSR